MPNILNETSSSSSASFMLTTTGGLAAETFSSSPSDWNVVPFLTSKDLDDFILHEEEENGGGGGGGGRILKRPELKNDNLFEVVPSCRICTNDEDLQAFSRISVTSSSTSGVISSSDTIGIVLDKELVILERGLEACPKHVKFEAFIDFILWRRSIILIGLSSSEIVLLDPATLAVKESRKVANIKDLSFTRRFFVNAAIHANPDPSKIDVTAIGVNGDVYLFQNVSLSDGTLDATHDQNMSIEVDIGTVRGMRINCLEGDSEVVTSASPCRNIVILGDANGNFAVRPVDILGIPKEQNICHCDLNLIEEMGYSPSVVQYKKLVSFEGLMFILLSNGRLEILLDDLFFPTVPLCLPDKDCIVHDFTLVLTNELEVKMWTLFGSSVDARKNFVGVFAGPDFKLEFAIKIPLTKSSTAKQGVQFHFPARSSPFEEPSSFIEVYENSTTIFRMVETSAEATIQKLLGRGKFDHALEVARECKQDVDVVYKAKARWTFNDLASIESADKNALFEDLLETLGKVRDPSFICEFCLKRGFSSLDYIRKLFQVGKERVKDCSTLIAGKEFLQIMKKFYTFQQVFPNGNIEEWYEFSTAEGISMFQQCKLFLHNQEFSKCEKVWRRHYDEFIASLKLEDFGPFFFTLFSQKLKTPEAVSLFRCIFPFAVEKCAEIQLTEAGDDTKPSAVIALSELTSGQLERVQILMNIVTRQVCSLEREKQWPLEATDFSKKVISIVKEVRETLNSQRGRRELMATTLICDAIADRVGMIVQNLTELAELIKCHSIRISFMTYINNDVIDVVNTMLEELFNKPEIEVFLKNFLVPFAARKELNIDVLFSEHVKSVVSELPFHINPMDVPQEERLICLISHISDPEIKLNSILNIAEEWPVPWPTNIDELVLSIINTRNNAVLENENCKSIVGTIKLMRDQVPFRCLLNKYRLTATKVHSYCGTVMAMKRIISWNRPGYFEDCLEFIKHTGFINERKLRCLEFEMKWLCVQEESEFDVENLDLAKWDVGLLKRLLASTLQHFKALQQKRLSGDAVLLQRATDICKLIANILDDRKVIEFFKLRDLIGPSFSNSDITYDSDYPFCALTYLMPEHSTRPTPQLLEACTKFSVITSSHLPDILVAAAGYFLRPGGATLSESEISKLWDIVKKVVSIPNCSLGKKSDNSDLIFTLAVNISHFLICHCPVDADESLFHLQRFLSILIENEQCFEQVSKIIDNLRVLVALREQEIPLENEFVQIYRWFFMEGVPGDDTFFHVMDKYGTTILKFGDRSLFKLVFRFISKELLGRASSFKGQEEKTACMMFHKRVRTLESDILKKHDAAGEVTVKSEIVELVELLRTDADIIVTPYALMQRDKSKLLAKLLAPSLFPLAAQVAIAFDFFELDCWSKILHGFIKTEGTQELKKVLLELRNISELWVLPEFSEGWKTVAAVNSEFLDICPIPLD